MPKLKCKISGEKHFVIFNISASSDLDRNNRTFSSGSYNVYKGQSVKLTSYCNCIRDENNVSYNVETVTKHLIVLCKTTHAYLQTDIKYL